MFASDAIARARTYLANLKGGLGAYQDSKGNAYIRQEIADSIYRNTGQVADADRIFISNGASECARMLLQALIRGPADGVLVPIPQYPLYSASIALYGGELVPYFLQEEAGWAVDFANLQASLDAARTRGVCVRALVFINPGNPTGQCLSAATIRGLLEFCFANRLILLADEVYQENLYTNKGFISARQILGGLQEPIRSGLELCSFHTGKHPQSRCNLLMCF